MGDGGVGEVDEVDGVGGVDRVDRVDGVDRFGGVINFASFCAPSWLAKRFFEILGVGSGNEDLINKFRIKKKWISIW